MLIFHKKANNNVQKKPGKRVLFFYSFSLRNALFIPTALLILAVITIIASVFFMQYSTKMTQQIAKSRIDVLAQTSERISATLNSIVVVSNFYYFNLPFDTSNYSTGEYSKSTEQDINDKFSQLDNVSQKTIDATNIQFDYVVLLSNGFVYSSNSALKGINLDTYKKKLWYYDIINANGDPVWISTHKNFTENEEYVFSYARSIINENTGESIGIFLADISETNISSTYDSLVSNNSIYVVDKSGKIISNTNKDMLGINFYNMDRFFKIFGDSDYAIIEKSKGKFLFSKYANSNVDWLIVEEIPLETVLSIVYEFKDDLLVIGIVVSVISFLIAYFIASRTSKPLSKLCSELEKFGKNEQVGYFQVTGWREINRICDECNSMSERISSLLVDVKQKEELKRQAEISFMQAQINPHFIYNTLFSIKCLVDMGDKEAAIGIIQSFTSILKNILTYTTEYIAIHEEIEFIRDYVKLQKYRYGDIFDLNIICSDDIAKCMILKMLIQPFVENSIFHGFNGIVVRGIITVSFEKQDTDNLIVKIEDNGRGLSEDEIANIWFGRKVLKQQDSNMIGIRNISDRIRLLYGNEYTVTIQSQPLIGTTITIILPYKAQEKLEEV